ncbi:hypothetical protein [Peloplasma aerotolerans]|uniref:Major membrane immunogen, membrane-anchored lipoprotein n=1 Tax=Peloplasma aerotolerans TaxID=3044389 RepID=A0AAW6U211_9MOLU|nr:hypothetical protein [Mariniplasma sp. M4Ah]MDI6452018.1 hypothetical protein [Mariniplasma sp. M4Ah]
MKKVLLMFFVAFAAITLIGCNSSEFKVDGEFMAYEETVARNAPQVTMVTVTIEDGKIVGYNIDTRQARRTATTTGEGEDAVTTYSWAWNAMTKKELGDDYGMVTEPDQLEWYEQAALIEAHLLENGVDSITFDNDGYTTDLGASVSITVDQYIKLAQEAVELAKLGKFQAVYTSGTDLYSAHMIVTPKGEIEELLLDVRQSTRDASAGTFVWNEKTKQELGFDYGMVGAGGYAFVDGAWVAQGTCTLEWFEQAALITDYVLANGWNDNLQPVAQRGGSLNGTTLIDELAAATIRTGGYFTILKTLFDFAGDSVK